jgi:hypothetical protein
LTTPPSRPGPAGRATRRSRRPAQRSATFLERNRSRLLWAVGALALVLVIGMAYLSFTRPTYACVTMFEPTPGPTFVAPSVAPVASGSPAPALTPPPPGLVQPDMGNQHARSGSTVTYTYCPPASGDHYNDTGIGPIRPGVYGPGDPAVPPGWVHNLEHGALVLLYNCRVAPDACTDAGQGALDALYARWPNSPICDFVAGTRDTPVFARFDDMPWAYAALVWDLVLPMQTLDEPLLLEFFEGQAEQFAPERLCALPTPTPGPTPTAGPATPTPAASPAASPAGSPAATTPAASPATSAAPSPS